MYNYENINDKEGFPLGLEQVLSDINSLLKNDNFNEAPQQVDQKTQNYLTYLQLMNAKHIKLNSFQIIM